MPHRSATNRRKMDSIKETPKTADLRRLMAVPNLRCQVRNAVVAAMPPIPNGTCIGNIVTDMAHVLLSTAVELECALSAPAENRVGARGQKWKLRGTQHGNR